MGSLEERVAYLEGRGEEHAAAIGEVRADIRDLRAEMNRRFDHLESRFDRMDGRFDHVDTKFLWLVGFQFTTLIAAIAALLSGYFR
jgi:hypothetical protein